MKFKYIKDNLGLNETFYIFGKYRLIEKPTRWKNFTWMAYHETKYVNPGYGDTPEKALRNLAIHLIKNYYI